jgi:hypothetical protein
MEKYIAEHGELTPTETEVTGETPLGNNFLQRVRDLRHRVGVEAKYTKDAVVDFEEKVEDALSDLGVELAQKLDELEGLTDVSSNWKEVCKGKVHEEHRLKKEQQALAMATKARGKVVSSDILLIIR